MIKKAFLILVAGLTAIEVFAQAPDTVSTVVGRKLNFEVPVFGITTRAFKPTWSVVAFEELAGLQYRPGRNENVISVGLLEDVNVNRLQKGYSFADDGSIIATPSNWCNASSTWSENLMGLQIGYIREFGDWKAGVFVIPGFGVTSLKNVYSIQDVSGISRQDNLNTNSGFRLGFKAGVWYHDMGLSVGYKPAVGNSSKQVPTYNSVQVGISIRY